MYLLRYLDFFGNDENDPIMTQNDPENDKNWKKFPNIQRFCAIFVIFSINILE